MFSNKTTHLFFYFLCPESCIDIVCQGGGDCVVSADTGHPVCQCNHNCTEAQVIVRHCMTTEFLRVSNFQQAISKTVVLFVHKTVKIFIIVYRIFSIQIETCPHNLCSRVRFYSCLNYPNARDFGAFSLQGPITFSNFSC